MLVGGGVVKGFGPKDLGWFRVWGGFQSRFFGEAFGAVGFCEGSGGADSMESGNGGSQRRS